jgi:hypothetical protein
MTKFMIAVALIPVGYIGTKYPVSFRRPRTTAAARLFPRRFLSAGVPSKPNRQRHKRRPTQTNKDRESASRVAIGEGQRGRLLDLVRLHGLLTRCGPQVGRAAFTIVS